MTFQNQYQSFLKKHPDGRISRKSFHTMMKECYPGADTEKLERHIFRMYDSNKDGHIDFREFMIVLYIMSNGSPEENLKQIFRVFDINNDGTISLKELQKIVRDLFLLINESNADQASQEVLVKTGDCIWHGSDRQEGHLMSLRNVTTRYTHFYFQLSMKWTRIMTAKFLN